MSASVHFLATVIWGIFGIVSGVMAIYYTYTSNWVWISIIVAVVGNSTHLVAFAISSQGVSVNAQGSSTSESNITGRQVVNGSGQVVGTIK